MLRGDLLSLDPDGHRGRLVVLAERRHVAEVVAALRPRVDGGWVAATEHGFAVTEATPTGPCPGRQVIDDPTSG